MDHLIRDNLFYLDGCREQGLPYIYIEDNYENELKKGIKALLDV